MSHVDDTSNQTADEVTSGSTSRSGVASSCSEVGGSVSKKLKFNENGLPIGPNSAKSSSKLGYLARMYIPICYSSWPKVDEWYKDQLWQVYKNEYPDVKERQKDILMKEACKAWEKFKSNLRGTLEGNDLIKWKEKVPQSIKSEDWEAFCDHEATQYQNDLRKRNKAIKYSCKRKSTHNMGNIKCDSLKEKLEKLDSLKEAMEGVKSTLTEFINDWKSGKFAIVCNNVHITSPTTGTPTSVTAHAPSNATPSLKDLISCEIQSHTGEIVGYGRKEQLGTVASVHGRRLRPREVRVVLDNIKVLDFPIWVENRAIVVRWPMWVKVDLCIGMMTSFLPLMKLNNNNNEVVLGN